MCPKCLQARTGKGIPHSCTQANRKQNIAQLVINDSGGEQIALKIVKDIVKKKQTENQMSSDSVKLNQIKGGFALTVTLGKRKEN